MTLATEVSSPLFRPLPARDAKARRVPILKTERLVLRAPHRVDVPAIVHLAGDRRVAESTARIPHPYAVEDAERYLATVNHQDSGTTFAIVLDGSLIGACGIDAHPDGAELGYWLGLPFWGRGYATEAVRAVIDFAFGEEGPPGHAVPQDGELQAGARVSNPASRRVLEKCGFQWTGVRLCRIRAINSAAPIDRFRLDRRLWASLKAWGQARQVA
jgi:RimJ/RimL family protein N-acetyltransferase